MYPLYMMIVLYILEGCPYCNRALQILKENNLKYKSIVVENTEEKKNYYKKQNKMNTFPQIFIKLRGDDFMKIGGCDNLIETLDYCKSIKSADVSIEVIYNMYYSLYKK
jgi:glutaredoxin 3